MPFAPLDLVRLIRSRRTQGFPETSHDKVSPKDRGPSPAYSWPELISAGFPAPGCFLARVILERDFESYPEMAYGTKVCCSANVYDNVLHHYFSDAEIVERLRSGFDGRSGGIFP
jgi:hypothetical protein